jgi:POT family proton-dependent oligopeptide transporter
VSTATATAPREREFLGHPIGLFVLFFTEMWERFSYYGMRSLLVLYMVNFLFLQPDVGQQVLGFNAVKGALESLFGPLDIQPLSSQIYGLYTAFVYLTPLFGGMLADRVLGQRRSVVLGGLLMALGQFLLMSPRLFFLGLFFLILGNGAFKPNISTQVGGLYREGDARRDGAFTIFYMGINLGAFLAPLIPGTLGQKVGWHWGFGASGVGMLLGLCLYLWGQKHLAPDWTDSRKPTDVGRNLVRIVLLPAVGIVGLLALLTIPGVFRTILVSVVVVGGIVAFLAWFARLSPEERMPVGALLVLCALNIVFWGCYEQQGNTMQLWADQNTNWNLFGFQVPSSWFQSFNPLMIFVFAPLLSAVWAWQAKRGGEPTSVTKMAIGCFLLGLSYIVMIVAAAGATPETKRSVMWLVGTTFVLTVGELYLSPIGLSLVTKVAPQRMVSMMMGAWFLSSFFGNYMSGFLGTFWEKWNQAEMTIGPLHVAGKQIFFIMLTALGLGTGVLMVLVNRPLNRVLAHHDRPKNGGGTSA